MSRSNFLLFLFAIILFSCNTNKPPRSRDREKTYNKPYHKEDTELKAQLFLYHGVNNTSFVYYKLNNSQLLYKKSDTSTLFLARLKFSYKIMPYAGAKQILDSGT